LRILSQPITGFIAAYLAAADLWLTNPLFIVALLSVVVGLAMVLLFGYTSDQKAIARAKDELKAHLLAVRLYRDQLHVVMGSYGKVLRGTGRYLRLAFKPLLYVILPITILIVQLDRTLGFRAIQPKTPFLLTVRTSGADEMNNISIELPPEIASDAPPVHVAAENEVVWRLIANHEGSYLVKIIADGQTAVKTVRVSSQLARVSPIRLRGHFWERMFLSGESALPGSLPLDSISVTYPERDIPLGFGNYQMNWIWLFFILSMIAGFIFKELLGIQI
jgi:uncharacterized membrane protein (DUF106 family)